ncbi:ATP-binding protein, partial [Streptomyces scabiei]|nr:ATP-binding protein [Streptomyces scabiei]
RTPAPAPQDTAVGTTEGGLPRRRRRTPGNPPVPEPREAPAAEERPGRSPEDNARIMGAFARGTRFGRAAGRILDEDEYVPDTPAGTGRTTPHDEGTPHA